MAILIGIGAIAMIAPGLSAWAGHAPSPMGRSAPFPVTLSAASSVPPSAPHSAAVRPAAFTLGYDGLTPSAISLNWTATTSLFFGSYTIYYSTNGSGGPWTSAGVVTSQGTTQFSVAGLSPGASYDWEVVSSALGGTTTSNVIAQGQPTLAYLNETVVSATSYKFGWTNNATYGGLISFGYYQLYEVVGNGTPTVVANISNVAKHVYTVTGLSSGTSYQFFLNTTDCYAGCGTATAQSSTTSSNTITLGTPLPLVASISATRPVVDVNELDYFTCTPSGGQSPFSFSWKFSSTSSYAAGQSSESHSFATNGTVVVTCLITDATTTRSSAATAVSVNTDPVVNATANRTAADVGQLVGFTCAASGGTSSYTLAWTFGDGTGAGAPFGSASHSYSGAAQYVPVCALEDGAGVEAARSLSLTVSPPVALTASASTVRAAPGTTLDLAAHPANGSGAYPLLSWQFGDGTTGTGANVSHAFAGVGNFTATARVVDSNGGSATATTSFVITDIAVDVGAIPSAARTGNLLTFTASANGGAGAPFNFTWSFSDGTVAYGALVAHSFAHPGTDNATVRVTDRLGAAVVVATTPVVVSAPPGPIDYWTVPVILGLAALAGLVMAIGVFLYRRRPDERLKRTVAGYVPPADPSRTVQGVKICRSCGTANLPIRETCANCGTSLPRNPTR